MIYLRNDDPETEEADEMNDEESSIDDDILDEVGVEDEADDVDTEGFGHINEDEEEDDEEEEDGEEDNAELEDDAEDVDYDSFDDIDEM